jgi:hypothetical protein
MIDSDKSHMKYGEGGASINRVYVAVGRCSMEGIVESDWNGNARVHFWMSKSYLASLGDPRLAEKLFKKLQAEWGLLATKV